MRYPAIEPDKMSPQQREVAGVIERSVGGLVAPYSPLIYSPETGRLILELAEFMQTGLRIPEPLRLMAVLIACKQRNVDFDALGGTAEATAAGLSQETVSALQEGRRPPHMTPDEAMVFDYCTELNQTGRIKNETFDRVSTRFGREFCMELFTLGGVTAMLAMIANVTRYRAS